jgi:acetoin utilization protein AcuB
MNLQKVRDVMTKQPITIDPDAPLATAAAVMREREIRHLPVIDAAGRLMGMITDRDLRSAVFTPLVAEYLPWDERCQLRGVGETLENLRVRDAMTWDTVTTGPDVSLAQAAAVMFSARVGSLAVVEAGRLMGIITERDVLRALAMTVPAIRGADPDTYLW